MLCLHSLGGVFRVLRLLIFNSSTFESKLQRETEWGARERGGGGGKKGNTLQADTSSSQWRRHGGSSPFGATFVPRQMNSARQKRRRKQSQRRTETTTRTTTWRTKRKGTQQFGEGHVNFHYKQKLKGSRRMPYGHKLPRPHTSQPH